MRTRKPAIKVAELLNTRRMQYGENQQFTKEEMLQILEGPLPKGSAVLAACVKQQVITRVERGIYTFNGPIHFTKIEALYEKLSASRPSVTKKKQVEDAISLLESSGFIVTADPVLPPGTKLSKALALARDLGYTITKE